MFPKRFLLFFIVITLFSCEKEELIPIVETPVATFDETIEYLTVPDYLSTPINGSELIVPIIILNWIPSPDGVVVNDSVTKAEGVKDWGGVVKTGMTVETINQWNLSNNYKVKYSVEEGSKFRGYSNPNAVPYVGIKVVKYINIYQWDIVWDIDRYRPDYNQIFKKIGLEKMVNDEGIKEVWINWVNYRGDVWIPESNMSSPLTGDISNSYHRTDDLPIYDKTYVVYGGSFDRWFAEMVHCRGHQLEAQLSYLNNTFFWQNFVGYPEGEPQPYNQGGRVGSTHFTPNSTGDYDYDNTSLVLSDIGDWDPNNNGTKVMVNNQTWKYERTVPFTYPSVYGHDRWGDMSQYKVGTDPQSGWLIYWLQSIPNKNSGIPYQKDNDNYIVSNWWDLFYNWDETILNNKKLYQ
jgi:hypothetical protein